jgi:hypothetical protein
MAKAKTIKLLLSDGTLDGLLLVEDNSWNGRMLACPRETIDDLLDRPDVKQYGVYILLSEAQVYIGQASDLRRRINQHNGDKGKDWWTRAVLLTTKDDSFNRSDIDFLEYKLISLAASLDTLHSDNKTGGNKAKVDEFRETELDQYLDNSLLLIELIGIRAFTVKKRFAQKTASGLKPHSRRVVKTHTTGLGRDTSKLIGKTLYLKGRGRKTGIEYSATFEYVSDKEVVIKKGSKLNTVSPSQNETTEWVGSQRGLYSGDISNLDVVNDITFNSINHAVRFVFGQAKNAWDAVKDDGGISIDTIARSD